MASKYIYVPIPKNKILAVVFDLDSWNKLFYPDFDTSIPAGVPSPIASTDRTERRQSVVRIGFQLGVIY